MHNGKKLWVFQHSCNSRSHCCQKLLSQAGALFFVECEPIFDIRRCR